MAARSTAFTLSLLLLLYGTDICAQSSLHVFNIDPSDYPIVSADFYAFGEDGERLRGLTPDDMIVTENLVQAPILSISCPDPVPSPDLSVVLSIDISGSMNGKVSDNQRTRLDVVKEAATYWAQEMQMNPSVCAVTSFNNLSYINQHFTYNRDRLVMAINNLKASNGTNYDDAMMGWPAGGLTVARAGAHKRVLIFLTDGMGTFTDSKAVIDFAKNNNIEVYTIAVGMSAPPVLRQLARESGGLFFEYLEDAEKIKAIYEIILRRVEGDPPCHIEWLSKGNCFGGLQKHRFVSFGIPSIRAADAGSYSAQASTSEFLSLSPSNLRFGAIPPGRTYQLRAKVKAVGGRITVSGFESSNPLYSIIESEQDPTFFPRTLFEDEELTLTVQFSPIDTTFTTGEVRLLTDGCEDPIILCSGGYLSPTDADLWLTHPNGGESFVVGSDTVITWKGVPESEPVTLEYSIDGGASWKLIGDNLTGLTYSWHVPHTPSDSCLARVTQKFANSHVTTFPHDAAVVDALFMADNRRVVTLTDNGVVTIWDAIRGIEVLATNGVSPASQLSVSRDGRLAAVGNAIDHTMLLWNLQTGDLIDIYDNAYSKSDGVGGTLKGILTFMPDGEKVLSVGSTVRQDSSLQIRDAFTGQILREIHDNREVNDSRAFFRHASLSPDGTMFAFACTDGIIQVWDADLTTVLKEWVDPSGDVSIITFSGDSETLLTAASRNSTDLTVTQWTPQGGVVKRALLRNTTFADLDILSSAENYLSSGDRATMRELSDGRIVREFPGHSGPVNTARYSSDGSLIVTASDDKTVRIWTTAPLDVAVDQSDALWAIIAPEAKGKDVDFGRVPVRVRKDSVVKQYIRNSGKSPIRILEMKIIGSYASDFAILSGDAPFELLPNEEWEVELGFIPGNPGSRRATMQIVTQSDTLLQNLVGLGVVPSLKVVGLLGDLIDFGKVPVMQQRDSVAVAVNIGTASLLIDSIRLSGPHPGEFMLTNNPAPLTVKAGDTLWLPVAFLPTDTSLFNGIVELFYNDVGSPTIVRLFGIGIMKNAPAISVPGFIEFKPQLCESYRDSNTISIVNPGDVPLNISKVELQGDPQFTLQSVAMPHQLDPGEVFQVQLYFQPDVPGRFTSQLRVVSDAVNSPESLIPVDGVYRSTSIEALDQTIDLGQLCPGAVYQIAIGVKNGGEEAVVLNEELIDASSPIASWKVDQRVGTIEPDSIGHLSLLLEVADSLGSIEAIVRFTDTLCGTEVVTRIVGSVAKPEVVATPVPVICPGDEVQLLAEGGVRYQWFPSEGLSCDDCQNPIAKPELTTRYYVTGYDAKGCSGTDSVLVTVRETPEVLFCRVGKYRVKPGDTVELKAELRSLPPIWAEVRELELEFKYDPSVLRVDPTYFAIPGDGTLLDGWEVELKGTALGRVNVVYRSQTGLPLQSAGALFRIRGEVFLANVVGTNIEWSLTTPEGCILFEPESGYVAVDSICGLNYRLFEVGGAKYRLDDPYPNPTTDEEIHVNFSLGLDGPTHLELIDLSGNRHPILSDNLDAGEYQARINTVDFSGGVYFIRLESGDWSQMIPVHILK
ncbi:MAG: choice-of-anchor D domain-containing protein [Ignavibacteriae bacterium]|nr:choice-of-anchor D domain-containing protein [Ignavibacteriota bacterium]